MRQSPFAAPLLLCALAAAQDPAHEADALLLPLVEQKLASDVAADVAWGGQLVWQHRLRQEEHSLLAALEKWRDRDGLEARFVRLHLVDGLLATGAKVLGNRFEFLFEDPLTRPAALALIDDNWPTNAAVVLKIAMAPAPREDRTRNTAARLVVWHQLKSVSFTRRVLDGLSAKMYVAVLDPGKESDDQWNSAVGLGKAAHPIRRPVGFPPSIRFWLSDFADENATIEHVFDQRGSGRVLLRVPDYRYESGELNGGPEVPEMEPYERWGLLRAMSDSKVNEHCWVERQVRDVPSYFAEIRQLRDDYRHQVDAALAQLRQRGWLGENDLVGYRIPLEVTIDDQRGDKSTALPELPPMPDPK